MNEKEVLVLMHMAMHATARPRKSRCCRGLYKTSI